MVVVAPGASLATDGGAVITADGRLVYDTLWGDAHFERSEFSSQRRLPMPTAIEGMCASLISLWHSNYHHWLFEALPRLSVLELAGFSGLPLIVPEHPAAFHRDMLAALGYPPSRQRAFSHEHVRPDVLVWASPVSVIGLPSSYAVDWLRSRFLHGREATPAPRRRIYLSRRLAYSRRVANEDEVVAALSRHGFETVDAEHLTFAQQVDLFASAEAVVSPHGAGLSNIVFGERLAVLEILQPRYLHLCYYALAGACGHTYWYLLAEPSDDRAKEADLVVPIGALVESVKQMLARDVA
jgi:capsular polysaccharide biosynthesis protein